MAGYKCVRLSRHTVLPRRELHHPLKEQETAELFLNSASPRRLTFYMETAATACRGVLWRSYWSADWRAFT
jgi:hypothetical protein